MLILTRGLGERFLIGDDVEVTILAVNRGQVRVGVTAPKSVPVHREEVYRCIKREEAISGLAACSTPLPP